MENQTSYRIRTNVGDNTPINIPVHLQQEYNSFEILSLKVNMDDTYHSYTSAEGIIIGRVSTANNGLGIPNVRVSIFVPRGEYDLNDEQAVMYPFSSPTDLGTDRVRYNLLPSKSDVECYQVIGTLPTKRQILDNETVLEVFDKFYKYTTVTNEAGDYMLSGIPSGKQRLHIDADLSDIGPFLSQRPYHMIENLGFDKNNFESNSMFKSSFDLDSLVQVISQNKSVYVYPYWGDATEKGSEMKITRTDLSLNYEFNTSAIFMGSIITDKQSNGLRQNCTPTEKMGKMSEIVTGSGRIEMIRKTVDDKIEQHRVKGDDLIDNNGVWCYQVPMNLDYVTTDEFGNTIPTDNPKKGIPTRARVRFRITLNEMISDNEKYKRSSYLVPNNPRIDDEKFLTEKNADYSFGSETWDESFVDMFMNNVYTVKNYIPQFQKSNSSTNRKHTGIKMVNHFGDNNPFPYNNISIKMNFIYRLICVIVKIFIELVRILNGILSTIGMLPCTLAKILLGIGKIPLVGKIFKKMGRAIENLAPPCIALSSEFCDDGVNKTVYYPGCIKASCSWTKTLKSCSAEQAKIVANGGEAAQCTREGETVRNCVENELAQSNEVTSFNFSNDWINGCLYMPLWFRKIKPKKRFLFGLFKRRAKDQWCGGGQKNKSQGAKLMSFCTVQYTKKVSSKDYQGETVRYQIMENKPGCKDDCHKKNQSHRMNSGVIMNVDNMFGQKVWYYKSVEVENATYGGYANEYLNNDGVPMVSKTLFATDIVMLGSLNNCDKNGVPKFFNYLSGSTYNMPTDILFTDKNIEDVKDANGNVVNQDITNISVSSGADWGNRNEYGNYDGGLFYSIGCWGSETDSVSCINLKRVCEIGVGLDEITYVEDITKKIESETDELDYENGQNFYLRPDGIISHDDLIDFDYRSMFATMNGNHLLTKINKKNGCRDYDFRHLYIDNFDGSLKGIMSSGQRKKKKNSETFIRKVDKKANYYNNHKLETVSKDYLTFRMGDKPYYYDGLSIVESTEYPNNGKGEYYLPKYENSFYFYFGLKEGKTAIDKFNLEYNAPCATKVELDETIPYEKSPNSWCKTESDVDASHSDYDGFLKFDFEKIEKPYSVTLNSKTNSSISYTFVAKTKNGETTSITDEKIGFCGDGMQAKLKGYTQIYLRYDNLSLGSGVSEEFCYIPSNDEYTMNVVDGIGNQHSYDISLNSEYLMFDETVTNFRQTNSTLREMFGANVYEMLSGKDKNPTEQININVANSVDPIIGRTYTHNGITTDVNGLIGIYNLSCYGENLNDFIIEVGCQDNDADINGWYNYGNVKALFTDVVQNKIFTETVNNGITEIKPSNDESLYFAYKKGNKNITGNNVDVYVIKVPKGGVQYNVRITQVCPVYKPDGKTVEYYKKTKNVVTRVITVEESTPYKLYINDVDYDIIKNFKTGWELSDGKGLQYTDEDKQGRLHLFKQVGDISKVKGWQNIADVNNPYYNWDADEAKYGKSVNIYTKVNDGDTITTFEYVINGTSISSQSVTISIDKTSTTTNKYIGAYKIDVEYDLALSSEPIEPTRNNGETEDDFNERYNSWSAAHQEWTDKVDEIEDKREILYNRLEFIDLMKDSFWFQEEGEEKDVNYYVQTQDNPYNLLTLYNSEEANGYNETYNETKSSPNQDDRCDWKLVSDTNSSIDGIRVPNLTSFDSQYFGVANDSVRLNSYTTTYGTIDSNGKITNGNVGGIAFAQDNIGEKTSNNGSISIKPPYVVACVNRAGLTKPNNLTQGDFFVQGKNQYGLTSFGFNNDGGNNGYVKKGDKEFFQYMFIDKIFSANVVSWAYINNIPYYLPWIPYNATSSDYDYTVTNLTNAEKERRLNYSNYVNKKGVSINTNGIVSGVIQNGVTNDTLKLSDFETKTAFGTNIEIETYSSDTEDSIPTRRCFYGNSEDRALAVIKDDVVKLLRGTNFSWLNSSYIDKFGFNVVSTVLDKLYDTVTNTALKTEISNLMDEISNKKVGFIDYRHVDTTDIEISNQYVLVPNASGELEVSDKDGSKTITKDLYGNMRIQLKSDTIHNSWDSVSTLNVSVVNGDSGNPTKYYIFQVNKSGGFNENKKQVFYPLNNFDFSVNDLGVKRFFMECNNNTGSWSWQENRLNAAQFFNKNTLERHFLETLVDTNVKSKVGKEILDETGEESGDVTYVDTQGYGNTGTFINLEHAPYFVVAVTENGNRTVSPVYDFTKIYFNIELIKDDNGGKFVRVSLDDVIDSNNLPNNYYLTQFDFTVKLQMNVGGEVINTDEIPYTHSTSVMKKHYQTLQAFKNDKAYFDSLDEGDVVSVYIGLSKWETHTKVSDVIIGSMQEFTLSGQTLLTAPKTYWYQTQVSDGNGNTEIKWATATLGLDGSVTTQIMNTTPSSSDTLFIGTEAWLYIEQTDANGVVKHYQVKLTKTNEIVEEFEYDPRTPYFNRYVDVSISDKVWKELNKTKSLLKEALWRGQAMKLLRDRVTLLVKDVTGLTHFAQLKNLR